MPKRLGYFFLCAMLVLAAACSRQDNKEEPKDAQVKAEQKAEAPQKADQEKTQEFTTKQISYAIGMDVATQILRLPTKLNPAEVNKGLMDSLEGKSKMTKAQQGDLIKAWTQTVREERIKAKEQNASVTKIDVKVKNLDELSYAVGMNIYVTIKPTAYPFDFNTMAKAINDKLTGAEPELTEAEQTQAVFEFQNAMTQKEKEKVKAEKRRLIEQRKLAGLGFLEKNKSNPGVKTTESGLQYKVIKMGDGPKPTKDDLIVVRYKGMFHNGTVFDSTFMDTPSDNLEPKRMIKGW